MAPKDDDAPIYNATYTLFRLSPLYVPDAKGFWLEGNLSFHARRFADSIQGDNLKTINTVLEEDDTVNRAGPFKQCRWQILGSMDDDDEDVKSADDLGILEGLQVNVEYERVTYTALFLAGAKTAEEHLEDEVKLPLVCIRMPAVLRSSLNYYMATIFDTRMEPLQLNSTRICKSLESFLDECAEDEDSFQKTVKEIQLTLSFSKPISASLKAIDVAIRRDDVPGFLKQGRAINSTSVTNIKSIEGVFMAALQKYLQAHLALKANTDQVIISRVACGAFALGKEGKMKLFSPRTSTDASGEYDSAAMASRRATAQVLQIILQTAIGTI